MISEKGRKLKDFPVETNGQAWSKPFRMISRTQIFGDGNSSTANTNLGLHLGFRVAYGHNQVSANNGGDANPQVLSGLEIDTKLCGVDTTCP